MARTTGVHLGLSGLLVLMTGIGISGPATSAGHYDFLFKPLREVLGMQQPIRIGVTRLHVHPLLDAPWQPLADTLKQKLGRPIQVVPYKPFQIRHQLSTGYLDLAILTATDYVEVAEQDVCIPLARPVNLLGKATRCGLIITAADSNITGLANLKGKRFAFGPKADATTHIAATHALHAAGLAPTDVGRELLPVPGARRHHLDSYEVAKAVIYERLPAGAVDEVEYSTWPKTGGSIFKGIASQDQVRIIARTNDLPSGPIVAAKGADPGLIESVKKILLDGSIKAEALRPMGWIRLEPADPASYDDTAQMLKTLRKSGWISGSSIVIEPVSQGAPPR